MRETDAGAYLDFFRAAAALKDTMRNSWTGGGRRESTAEHCWRLCLMAVTLEDELPGIDLRRLLELLVVHDLGEAVSGDIPAPLQGPDKTADERADFVGLLAPLPERVAARLSRAGTSTTPSPRRRRGWPRGSTGWRPCSSTCRGPIPPASTTASTSATAARTPTRTR